MELRPTTATLLAELTELLRRAEILVALVSPLKGNVLEVGSWRFQKNPQYYPATQPRASFRVTNGDSRDYFLKINSDQRPILREVKARALLNANYEISFRVPPILAFFAVGERQAESHGWFVTDWVEGHVGPPSNTKNNVSLVARTLSSLHQNPLSLEQLEKQLQVEIPPLKTLASRFHKQRLTQVREIQQRTEGLLAKRFKLLEEKLIAIPLTDECRLIHGDFHFYNILFPDDPVNEQLAFVDWEGATLENPLSDVGHLLNFEFNDNGRYFLEEYLEMAASWMDERQLGQAHVEAWLLTGVWFARCLRWDLNMANNQVLTRGERYRVALGKCDEILAEIHRHTR